MIQFRKDVDTNSREAMISFLKTHPRYDTANSWNRSTSYANNVKIYNLGLDKETEDKLYEMLDMNEYWSELSYILRQFGEEHGWKWQADFNGHSSGYVVLYQGELNTLDYKSYCKFCFQPNYQEATEENCRCGKCGKDGRVNLIHPLTQTVAYAFRPVDMNEDFEDWTDEELKERVELVQDFDSLCDSLVQAAADIASDYDIEYEEVVVKEKRKVLQYHG